MVAKVTELADHRPHLCIMGASKNAHVFPVAMIQDVIDGKLKFTDVEDWEDIIGPILEDWLSYIKEE